MSSQALHDVEQALVAVHVVVNYVFGGEIREQLLRAIGFGLFDVVEIQRLVLGKTINACSDHRKSNALAGKLRITGSPTE